ncbi:pentatricopeptide repeat-containing protein At5g40410, mitochondrial-like [Vitis riparia]|uniref:pentatricopeptide repeat-containing protein At5g40410, mitochondrial-like n=1 Tax=Vitis riparia TaxID=96939 RepID=UPI00155A37B6|nr:pentatricopeptide repeat-containing protein At5g40410, mitochondrial-like [Vitis riparia]
MVGKRLINLQACHSGRYILLSNIYAAAKKWDDARKVRNLMKVNGISKVPGVSVIELKGMVHRFVAGDWSHPESNKIYEKLNEIHKAEECNWVFSRYRECVVGHGRGR